VRGDPPTKKEQKMKNEMKINNEIVHPIDNGLVITSEVIVSCCGCNEEIRITREEADEWTDTDWFMCHECE
jgi:hypothetical protein